MCLLFALSRKGEGDAVVKPAARLPDFLLPALIERSDDVEAKDSAFEPFDLEAQTRRASVSYFCTSFRLSAHRVSAAPCADIDTPKHVHGRSSLAFRSFPVGPTWRRCSVSLSAAVTRRRRVLPVQAAEELLVEEVQKRQQPLPVETGDEFLEYHSNDRLHLMRVGRNIVHSSSCTLFHEVKCGGNDTAACSGHRRPGALSEARVPNNSESTSERTNENSAPLCLRTWKPPLLSAALSSSKMRSVERKPLNSRYSRKIRSAAATSISP